MVQLTPPQTQLPSYLAGNIPVPFAGMPTASLVDVNGQMVVVSNLALPLSQPVQQHPLQQMPVPQPFVTPPVQNSTASVGSQTQSQSNSCDAHPIIPTHNLPSPRSRAVSGDPRHSENPPRSAKTHAVPRPNRPAGSSGSNWSVASRTASSGAKNGRLIGTGGVGKVLHYLDTLRSEVVEADRSMASLQSDNRFLRDKNKELEAKISNLERQLAEEKGLRHAAEIEYRSLCQRIRDHDTDAIYHQSEPGIHHLQLEPTTSTEDSLVFLDGSTVRTGETLDSDRAVSREISKHLNDFTAEPKIDDREGAGFEDSHPSASTANDKLKQPNKTTVGNSPTKLTQINPPTIRPRAITVPDTKPPPARNNESYMNDSFKAPDVTPKTHHVSQYMTSLSSIAKQFDPLGTSLPSPSFHCIPAIANINNENVAIPLIVTTTQPTSSPLNSHASTGETRCRSNANNKTNHFDPLGTPGRSNSSELDKMSNVPALVHNGMPQMPAMTSHAQNGGVALPVILPLVHQQQQLNQQEDPFDEIVRMSRNHGTT